MIKRTSANFDSIGIVGCALFILKSVLTTRQTHAILTAYKIRTSRLGMQLPHGDTLDGATNLE